MKQVVSTAFGNHRWLPMDTRKYHRSPSLTNQEQSVLARLASSSRRWGADGREEVLGEVRRLADPLQDVMSVIKGNGQSKDSAFAAILRNCCREKMSFWGWSLEAWAHVLGPNQAEFFKVNGPLADGDVRQYMAAAGHLLGCFTDIRVMGECKRVSLANKIFGVPFVEAAVAEVEGILTQWGYSSTKRTWCESALCEALMLNRSPHLYDLSGNLLLEMRNGTSAMKRSACLQISRALVELGYLSAVIPDGRREAAKRAETQNIASTWVEAVTRWLATSTLEKKTRNHSRVVLLEVGRWLASQHPEVTEPSQWTSDLAIRYVAAVDQMKVGEYAARQAVFPRRGLTLSARSKAGYLCIMRTFFRDCQEWGWIPRRFDPNRSLATPRSVKALIGPSPRIISDDSWARLLWAGLNLTAENLHPAGTTSIYYPVEMVRALAAVWLLSGIRSDEITRLRVGCVRWRQDPTAVTGQTPEERVCLLDIPVNKTGTAFTKPVDAILGLIVQAWEHVRPAQPTFPDSKTGEIVDFLFCYRARPLPREYINDSLIPILCRKAGIPVADARGPITSHRARATIASQLFNSRNPMTLFELQAWLGHRSPTSTQSYVALTPTRLIDAYANAGYLGRNIRAIEVLIDRDALKSVAATGQPWRYYDLGHSFCTYEFFDQCPHRMACARCDFCLPKESSQAHLVEAKAGITHMLQEVPLTEPERAAVDGDLTAVNRLLELLRDQPTPAGMSPRQMTVGATADQGGKRSDST
jgi:integrase